MKSLKNELRRERTNGAYVQAAFKFFPLSFLSLYSGFPGSEVLRGLRFKLKFVISRWKFPFLLRRSQKPCFGFVSPFFLSVRIRIPVGSKWVGWLSWRWYGEILRSSSWNMVQCIISGLSKDRSFSHDKLYETVRLGLGISNLLLYFWIQGTVMLRNSCNYYTNLLTNRVLNS